MAEVSSFHGNAASGNTAGSASANGRLKIAVVGSGISGLSAAWLLSGRHDVTVYEKSGRVGGHSHTVRVKAGAPEIPGDISGEIPVDMGFIVFNRVTYPNLTALFAHLGVATHVSDMSFAASLDGGGFEYSGNDLAGLFAQKRNILRPRFWSMLWGIRKFYRDAESHVAAADSHHLTLGEVLAAGGYGPAFRDDHLLPMASAIWSSTPADMLSFPALAFIRFHANHGLLQVTDRPAWETVTGGSISYVSRLLEPLRNRIRSGAQRIERHAATVRITDTTGHADVFDHVIIATHADEALALLADPTAAERSLLGAFRYQRNRAVLHGDPRFMPKRRAAWASWNYIGGQNRAPGCFTYWMNRLQNIPERTPLFVTLNPPTEPVPEMVFHREDYDHPVFDSRALFAQSRLWELQGTRRTWFCGAHFGAGFHEDGLQAGLAVAEELGGVRRPWNVANESGRIVLGPVPARDVWEPAA